MTLETLREEISAVDDQLYALFARRMEISRQIGRQKDALGLPIYDAEREKKVMENARARAGESLAPYAEELCQTLMQLSRQYQQKDLTESR